MAQTICLTCIVKNESLIIERLLDSCKPIIDCIAIVDTGSVDNTIEIIQNWAENNEVKLQLMEEKFENFGKSRTTALKFAKEVYPEVNWLLTLDADMRLLISSEFDKNTLSGENVLITQKNNYISYENSRLLNNRFHWKSIGVTHEYTQSEENTIKSYCNTLLIEDHCDGSNRSNKFKRDVNLLTEALKSHNVERNLKSRYYFYLAQTYFDMNNYPKALEYYKKRIVEQGWAEEIFYSIFKKAKCYENMKQPIKALNNYIKAFHFRPSRAEPIYEIMRLFNNRYEYEKTMIFYNYYKQCKDIKEKNTLFRAVNDVKYGIKIQKAVALYRVNYTEFNRVCIKYNNKFENEWASAPDNIKTVFTNIFKWAEMV